MKKYAIASVITLITFFIALVFTPFSSSQSRSVSVQILAINDFHGNLETGSLSITLPDKTVIPAGGVEYLASHIQKLRATNPNTVVVSAGDAIGATPLLSALFHDEPAIAALNGVGLDLNGVGNHEFDRGALELLRMQNGGCHPVDGCSVEQFTGAKFKFLAANVIDKNTNKSILPAYEIREFDGIKIAFIGMTLEATPKIVSPSGVAGLYFKNEAETVNALIPELKKAGVKAIAVLIHEGGSITGSYNECPGISGAIVDIVKRTDPEVDLFITGHTHQAYICTVDKRLVTSAASFGRLVTDIDLTLDLITGDISNLKANNVVVDRNLPKSEDLSQLVGKYQAIAAPLTSRVIGSIRSDLSRSINSAGESDLGKVIADSQLAATQILSGAAIAFTNPGGIRADLTYVDGNVTYGQAFTVQPFGNSLVTMTLTGAQIKELLEQQFDNPIKGQNRILQVSQGFRYAWSTSANIGNKVSNIKLNDRFINPNSEYRITVNNYLADGGDNFSVLKVGKDRIVGVVDVSALESYLRARSPIESSSVSRITVN
jgi:5'-nucleotidase